MSSVPRADRVLDLPGYPQSSATSYSGAETLGALVRETQDYSALAGTAPILADLIADLVDGGDRVPPVSWTAGDLVRSQLSWSSACALVGRRPSTLPRTRSCGRLEATSAGTGSGGWPRHPRLPPAYSCWNHCAGRVSSRRCRRWESFWACLSWPALSPTRPADVSAGSPPSRRIASCPVARPVIGATRRYWIRLASTRRTCGERRGCLPYRRVVPMSTSGDVARADPSRAFPRYQPVHRALVRAAGGSGRFCRAFEPGGDIHDLWPLPAA